VKTFRERLEKLIEIAGSMRAAERLLGISPIAIRAWVGGSKPLDSKLRGVCARTGLSEAWLTTGMGDDDEQLERFRAFITSAPTPRERLRRAVEKSGMTAGELARKIGYDSGVVERALSGGRASERMIEAICRVIPGLDKHELLSGADEAPMIREGVSMAHGAKVNIVVPGGVAWNAPLLSFAQAGKYDLAALDDDWNGETEMVTVKDRRAFVLRIEGDSMTPLLDPGDLVVVSPSHEPGKNKPVVVKTISGEVFCKRWGGEKNGLMIFNSLNPAHEPLILPRAEVAFIYPVAQTIKNHLL
jgi:phage repressor protein C with HTH and peptisase S24 domain